MKKLKTVVCDDDPQVVRQLNDYLEEIGKTTGFSMNIFNFSSAEELLQDMPDDTDILFLDIQMPGINGIAAAEQLRKRKVDFYLILITGNIEYAIEGYSVHAYAFLPKPISYSSVKRELMEIAEHMEKERDPVVSLSFQGETTLFHVHDILYIEVYKHDLHIVTTHDQKHYHGSLSDLEEKLIYFGFFRCHKSYLVNFAHIISYNSHELTMDNQEIIPLSKYKAADFLQQFTNYQGNSL